MPEPLAIPPSSRATPELTDRRALLLHRARARRASEPAFFLQHEAVLEAKERLQTVNRTFNRVAIVAAFPDLWREAFPDARIVGDDEVLDLEPGAHDAVIHAMALHWADDPIGQIVQCHQALRPDGLFLGIFFGGQTLNELRTALAEAEAEITGGLSPRVAPMAEIRDAGSLLQRSGLALPVADNFTHAVHYRDLSHLVTDLRAMGETNALFERSRRMVPRTLFARAAEIYAESFPAENGRITATFEFICLTGWAPHESQQKPLRPGSATHRLADALNTTEYRLPRGE